MSITPFHFVCHLEERLRAQFEILDAALGAFVHIQRRMSLTESRACLQFGAKPGIGEDFVAHATFTVSLVPQKERQTALNCVLDCPAAKMHRNFRLLVETPDQAETQILKILEFLQKAFLPLGYAGAAAKATPSAQEIAADPTPSVPAEAVEVAANAGGVATLEPGATKAVELAPGETEKTLSTGSKYIQEQAPFPNDTVRMRTHDGAYVPEGALPAALHVAKTEPKADK